MIPAVAKSQVGRGSVAAPARLEAKADEILKVHRDAAKVAKARKLSPAFDAECRAAEEEAERLDVSQWTVRQHVMYGLGYSLGWLRGRWAPLEAFITLTWIVVKL